MSGKAASGKAEKNVIKDKAGQKGPEEKPSRRPITPPTDGPKSQQASKASPKPARIVTRSKSLAGARPCTPPDSTPGQDAAPQELVKRAEVVEAARAPKKKAKKPSKKSTGEAGTVIGDSSPTVAPNRASTKKVATGPAEKPKSPQASSSKSEPGKEEGWTVVTSPRNRTAQKPVARGDAPQPSSSGSAAEVSKPKPGKVAAPSKVRTSRRGTKGRSKKPGERQQVGKGASAPAPLAANHHKERGSPKTPVLQALQEMKVLLDQLEELRLAKSAGSGTDEALFGGLTSALPALSHKLAFVTGHSVGYNALEERVELMSKKISDIRGSQLPRASTARTFADTVKATPTPVPTQKADKVYCVEIFPEKPDTRSTSDGTKEKLLRSIKPCDFGFLSTRVKRNPRNKSVLVESTSPNVVKLIGAASLAKAGLRAAEAKKRKPLLSIYGVESKTTEVELVEAIRKQNGLDLSDQSQVRPVFRFGGRGRPTTNWCVEVSPDVRFALLRKGKIGIGWSMCSVEDRLMPMLCRRCCRYGHTAARCREADPVCGVCAARNHESRDCPKRLGDQRSCGVCSVYSRRSAPHGASHRYETESCPEHQRRIRDLAKDTDYGF